MLKNIDSLSPAVFLDRDGTISPEVGYLSDPSKFELLPGAADSIRNLNEAGYKVFVVTNQSGIALGFLSIEILEQIHSRMKKLLANSGAYIDKIYFCPHHPTKGNSGFTIPCSCRKPEHGMILQAAKDYKLDLLSSFIIGDKLTDVNTGKSLGLRSILVLTGYGKEEKERLSSESVNKSLFIAKDIAEAVDWILIRQKN
jgi:D-glycero-D-manno-heptose 1,7-bisphosphate phosphatase